MPGETEMNAKRGYVPEDEKNFSEEAIGILRKASGDLCYLINAGYDLKTASTFVGNHYLLSERQRLAIVRSVAGKDQLSQREKCRISMKDLEGSEVWIDGFNVIITLEVLLNDSILLECMDGCIRDLASLRGTYRVIRETSASLCLLFECLKNACVQKASILLDEPVSNSGRLKTLIAEIGEDYPVKLDIQILRDVDRVLYGKEKVITSDSVILDHCISWVNLLPECVNKTGKEPIKVWL